MEGCGYASARKQRSTAQQDEVGSGLHRQGRDRMAATSVPNLKFAGVDERQIGSHLYV
jgi:hypothetical protein